MGDRMTRIQQIQQAKALRDKAAARRKWKDVSIHEARLRGLMYRELIAELRNSKRENGHAV
jgi:hypothetical protein